MPHRLACRMLSRSIRFTGPITRQDGTVVGEPGKPLPDNDLLSMNWYVKGVDDKLPQ